MQIPSTFQVKYIKYSFLLLSLFCLNCICRCGFSCALGELIRAHTFYSEAPLCLDALQSPRTGDKNVLRWKPSLQRVISWSLHEIDCDWRHPDSASIVSTAEMRLTWEKSNRTTQRIRPSGGMLWAGMLCIYIDQAHLSTRARIATTTFCPWATATSRGFSFYSRLGPMFIMGSREKRAHLWQSGINLWPLSH